MVLGPKHDDLFARRLYKRLFVFTKERSEPDWNVFIENWERLSPMIFSEYWKKQPSLSFESPLIA